uniref:Uncharacterized protein n=1 Tax=Anguilla anguilla TaxID=7936 RepID=A0A0E9T3U5_ANGAN
MSNIEMNECRSIRVLREHKPFVLHQNAFACEKTTHNALLFHMDCANRMIIQRCIKLGLSIDG